MEEPDYERAGGADQKTPVQGAVVAEGAEDPPRADEAPDDRCVEEDAVAGASPGAVRRKELVVADVLDRSQEPPRNGQVDCAGNNGSNKLGKKIERRVEE